NQYKAKRTWPPDFSKLSPRHQFRLERRYRRRTKLKWARPRWTKAVKITQLASVTSVYGVLFMEWNSEGPQPFQGIRNWFFGFTGLGRGRENRQPKSPEDTSPVATTSS
ncbi:hypothetical protein DH86_00003707, partial [Scytalidium sp. 3C]